MFVYKVVIIDAIDVVATHQQTQSRMANRSSEEAARMEMTLTMTHLQLNYSFQQ